MPILLRGCIGIGHSAATHHSGNYYPLFAHFPGLRVVVPSTPYDAKGLLNRALRSNDPVLFLEHRELLNVKKPVPRATTRLNLARRPSSRGPRRHRRRPGLDGPSDAEGLRGTGREGISVELIDPRTVAPLDVDTIRRSVAKTGRLLIVDEAFAPFGVGAEIAAQLADRGFDDLDAPIRRLNGVFARPPTARRWRPPSSPTPTTSPGPFAIWWTSKWDTHGDRNHIPRLGWNMDEGTFVGWLKADGQPVAAGEPLFNLEGDKATQEIESLENGILRIPPDGPKDGDKVAVGAIVGYLVGPGETAPFDTQGQVAPSSIPTVLSSHVEAQKSTSPLVGEVPPQAAVRGRPGAATNATHVSITRGKKQPISPRARRVARELGVNVGEVTGSGKGGRIVERDIRAVAGKHAQPGVGVAASTQDFREITAGSIRKTIAARMLESKQTTAAVTITTTVDATNLVNLRRQFKNVASTGETPPIGYTDVIVKLTALALEKHPMLNSRWNGEKIRVWSRIHIGIAVDTEAGLIVPVIRDVPRLSLRELAAQSRALAQRARAGKLSAPELSGSTFTISNLGQMGVEMFTPLINPPECAILGLGRIQKTVVVENKQFVERDRMAFSLTFDHRIVDGAPAARFLQALGLLVENPSPWLLS